MHKAGAPLFFFYFRTPLDSLCMYVIVVNSVKKMKGGKNIGGSDIQLSFCNSVTLIGFYYPDFWAEAIAILLSF